MHARTQTHKLIHSRMHTHSDCEDFSCCIHTTETLGLSDTTVLAIYRDILKVSISRYFVINYRDTTPVHYCH